MRHYEYIIIFSNGETDRFYSFSIMGAFCAATFYMSNKGKHHQIKSIEDEMGDIYTNFELIYTKAN